MEVENGQPMQIDFATPRAGSAALVMISRTELY